MTALDETFRWSPMTPDQQKRKLNFSVSAIMSAMALPEAQRMDVRSAYVIAEDLALRRTEVEYSFPFVRHAIFEDMPFDAIAIKNKTVFCVEVAFLATPEMPQNSLEVILKKVDNVNERLQSLRSNFKAMLLLLLITQFAPGEGYNLHQALRRELHAHASVEVDVRLFDFDDLQNAFLNE